MSRLEVKIWRTLRAKGPRPVRQHQVKCGDTADWIDCAFPQWRVAVEGSATRSTAPGGTANANSSASPISRIVETLAA
jgi:hypothetical protein